MWGGIYDRDGGSTILCGLKARRKACVGQGHNYRAFTLAGIFPACGARLRIKINDDARLSCRLSGGVI